MRVWRLARSVYPVLDGEGARLYGGRWNAPGTPMVYAAESLSLAALELLVHLNPDRIPEDLVAYAIDIPDGLDTWRIDPGDLPDGWNRRAEVPELRQLGEAWVQDAITAVLNVPSAVIPEERNVLINPQHPEAPEVRVGRERPFSFDPRLFE
jgi:RES domain-containing protein